MSKVTLYPLWDLLYTTVERPQERKSQKLTILVRNRRRLAPFGLRKCRVHKLVILVIVQHLRRKNPRPTNQSTRQSLLDFEVLRYALRRVLWMYVGYGVKKKRSCSRNMPTGGVVSYERGSQPAISRQAAKS